MFAWFSLKSGIRGEADYLSQVDALRGWAILLVFLFHAWGIAGGQADESSDSLWFSFVAAGRTGVTLFFVISGFLLSLPWLRTQQSPGAPMPNLKHYYTARVLRIVPLYYAAVLLACLFSGSWGVGFKALTFQFVGFDIFPFSVVWWTLVTEVQFYLLLPLLMWLLLSGNIGRVLLALILLIWFSLYVAMVLNHSPEENLRSYFLTKSLFGRLPAFLIGIFAAWIYLRAEDLTVFRSQKANMLSACTVMAALASIAFILRQTLILGEWQSESGWHIHHTYEALLWSLVLLAFTLTRPVLGGVVSNAPMSVVGKLSYSLYLWHVPILFYLIYPVKTDMGAAYLGSHWAYLLTILALVLSLAGSLLSYKYIELPGLELKRRLTV